MRLGDIDTRSPPASDITGRACPALLVDRETGVSDLLAVQATKLLASPAVAHYEAEGMEAVEG